MRRYSTRVVVVVVVVAVVVVVVVVVIFSPPSTTPCILPSLYTSSPPTFNPSKPSTPHLAVALHRPQQE
ncbi:hypothetical protein E2C01_030231 [Portunus trituberculatus]|uniref:Uncharacterized protein n=1 Tax=Portunus trituberculatus TaxID=210409 RepID=A0A5B7EV54_PORTR|nr:hypothetical protein [Portunus trituberculatus]